VGPGAWELREIRAVKAFGGVCSFPFLVSFAEYVVGCSVVGG
jgi:hypothetical protein